MKDIYEIRLESIKAQDKVRNYLRKYIYKEIKRASKLGKNSESFTIEQYIVSWFSGIYIEEFVLLEVLEEFKKLKYDVSEYDYYQLSFSHYLNRYRFTISW